MFFISSFASPTKKNRSIELQTALVAILSLSFAFYLGKSYDVSLRGIDSNIHAIVSMNVTSQSVLPKLPMPGPNSSPYDQKAEDIFNDHPFFYFWTNGWVMRLFGPSAWSARFLTAFFSTSNIYLTFLIGEALGSTLLGLIAAVFCLFCRDLILTGATVSLDPPMLFFILLSFIFWIRSRWMALGIATGIGLWIKTPIVLLIYPVGIIFGLLHRKLKNEKRYWTEALILTLGIGSLVWVALGMLGGWNWVWDYWMRQVWGTAIEGRQGYVGGIPFFKNAISGMKVLAYGYIPSVVFFILGWRMFLKAKAWNHPLFKVSLLTIAIVFLLVSSMRFNLGHYYNPIFPFLALLTALAWEHACVPFERRIYYFTSMLTLLLLSILLTNPIPFAPEAFIALRRFVPILQTYSDCHERLTLVSGGEPVGSSLDYGFMLNFYAGRKVQVISCEQVKTLFDSGSTQWIILSYQNYLRCIPDSLKSQYISFLSGNQLLVTNLSKERMTGIFSSNQKITDLTFLDLDLKATIDCQKQRYPIDRYHKYVETN